MAKIIRYTVTLIKDWYDYKKGTILNGLDQDGYDELIKDGFIIDETKPKKKIKKEVKKDNNNN